MGIVIILTNYLIWHYTRAIMSLINLYRNFSVFLINFFSLPMMIRTWLSPWRRLNESYPSSILDYEVIFTSLIVNILMRLVGFVARTVIILVGLSALALLVISLPIVLVVWLALPLAIIFIFLLGLGLLFK